MLLEKRLGSGVDVVVINFVVEGLVGDEAEDAFLGAVEGMRWWGRQSRRE